MVILITIAFFLAVTGSFLLLSLSPFAFLEGLAAYVQPKNPTLKWTYVNTLDKKS